MLPYNTESYKITQMKIFQAKTFLGNAELKNLRQILVKRAGRLKKPKAMQHLKRLNGC
jgi:hypothetical protein